MTKVERRARIYAGAFTYINEVWACTDCKHYMLFRLPPESGNPGYQGSLRYCCECGIVLTPSWIRDDSVCYAMAAALC